MNINSPMIKSLAGLFIFCFLGTTFAAENRIDTVRFDAPELARFGEFDIGVRTLEITASGRPDILNTVNGGDTPDYDRKLIVEVWYPAKLINGQRAGGVYTTPTRNPGITATLHGRAVRGADPLPVDKPAPFVIISHGYPGNRFLMSHLAENLASKGYVVASINHRDSTYLDQQAFASTLYNRPLDQLIVLDEIESLSASEESFLSGMVDATNTGIVGYSMGGYGLTINLGGGVSEVLLNHEIAPPNKLAFEHAARNPEFLATRDQRIRAGFLVAPWGMENAVWRAEDLSGISAPTFWLSGSADEVAGYERGTRTMFENARQSDRYLLTFLNAGHNAGAPMPLPVEFEESDDKQGADHYVDAVWDSVRMNNVMDHFATAFFDLHLKGDGSKREYLRLVPSAEDGVFSMVDGTPTAEHTYWKGFPPATARGLVLEYLEATTSSAD